MIRRSRLVLLSALASLPALSLPGQARAEPVTVGRVSAEVLGVTAGFAGSVLLGVGVGTASPRGGGDLITDAEAYGVLAFLGGIVFVVPIGATVGGNLAGGRGSYGYTLLGNLSGLAAGTLIAIPLLSAQPDDTRAALGVSAIVGGMLAGNVLGYELSSAGESADEGKTGTRLELRPMALVSPEGAVFGASGGF